MILFKKIEWSTYTFCLVKKEMYQVTFFIHGNHSVLIYSRVNLQLGIIYILSNFSQQLLIATVDTHLIIIMCIFKQAYVNVEMKLIA